MKRPAAQLIQNLERLGFDHIWTNASGFPCYAHPDDPQQTEVSINPNTSENGAKTVLRRAQKIAGTRPATDKRNAGQVKERAAADRDRARQRLQWIRDKRDQLTASHADPKLIGRAAELVGLRERELADLERVMVQPPASGNTHRGTRHARHRTGARP